MLINCVGEVASLATSLASCGGAALSAVLALLARCTIRKPTVRLPHPVLCQLADARRAPSQTHRAPTLDARRSNYNARLLSLALPVEGGVDDDVFSRPWGSDVAARLHNLQSSHSSTYTHTLDTHVHVALIGKVERTRQLRRALHPAPIRPPQAANPGSARDTPAQRLGVGAADWRATADAADGGGGDGGGVAGGRRRG